MQVRQLRFPRSRIAIALSLVLLTALLPAASTAQDEELSEEWGWIVSPNFKILTNASPKLVQGIVVNLERFRLAFSRLSPDLSLKSPIPVRMVAFYNFESYAPYKNPPSPAVLGQFVRNLDGHYLTFHAGASKYFAVDYHEYVHYLVDGNLPTVPRWFNEGLAEYYSTFRTRGDTVTVGLPVERHVKWFKASVGAEGLRLSYEFSLADVVSGRASQDPRKVGGFYAFSWALVHYLLTGPEQRLVQTADFLARLGEGEDSERAFELAFEQSLDDFKDEVTQYVLAGEFKKATLSIPMQDSLASVYRARKVEVEIWLGDLAAQIGNLQQAEMHYETARQLAPERPEPLAGLGALRDYEKRFDESSLFFIDANERRPRDSRTLLRYGRHLLTDLLPEESEGLIAGGRIVASSAFAQSSLPFLDDPVAAVRAAVRDRAAKGALEAFEKALQVDPNHAGVLVHVGIAHLFADAEPDDGIKALQDVRQWLPQDRAIAFYLLQLHLKKKQFKAARRLLTESIGDAYPELSLQAEEEIDRAHLVHRAGQALEAGEPEIAKGLFDEAISLTSDHDLRERMTEILLAFEREREAVGSDEAPYQ